MYWLLAATSATALRSDTPTRGRPVQLRASPTAWWLGSQSKCPKRKVKAAWHFNDLALEVTWHHFLPAPLAEGSLSEPRFKGRRQNPHQAVRGRSTYGTRYIMVSVFTKCNLADGEGRHQERAFTRQGRGLGSHGQDTLCLSELILLNKRTGWT